MTRTGALFMDTKITELLNDFEPRLSSFLCDAIRYKSLRGQEQEYIRFLYETFSALDFPTVLMDIPENIVDDPDYAWKEAGLSYTGRPNILITVPGKGNGKSLTINTHTDVVPATPGDENAFSPIRKNSIIYGRGAVDTKGQVAAIYGLLTLLKTTGTRLQAPLQIHLVIEEEVGGNGTLHMVRSQQPTDGALVMEPSTLDILPAVRGSVWFELTCTGKAGHSGNIHETVNAIELAAEAMEVLKTYHAELLNRSKGNPLFKRFNNPMPLVFGELHAGNWPSVPAQQAVLRGFMGFMTNTTKQKVQQELKDCLAQADHLRLKEHCSITFSMINNDSYAIPVDHPLVTAMQQAVQTSGLSPVVRGMPAGCDAWMYNNLMKVPTIVFGPGDISVAHSDHEHIDMHDITRSVRILYHFLAQWNGFV